MTIIKRDDRVIKLGPNQHIYQEEVGTNFDHYFSAVEYYVKDDEKIVDYSTPGLHKVIGFDLFPVHFPSVAEPINTTSQYLDFAKLQPGNVVIDLGAYSGLTSILFKQLVGPTGKVVAVEADEGNVESVRINFIKYHEVTNTNIEYVHAAAWNNCHGLSFSSDGGMGSSVTDYIGHRGTVKTIPSVTLSKIVEMFNLERVDFIKCDIEGAERVVFDDPVFFSKFKPRIIVELHNGGRDGCVTSLERAGYTHSQIKQEGSEFPLLEFIYENSNTGG